MVEIRFSLRKLLQIGDSTLVPPKDAMPQNFAEKAFANGHKILEVFSLERFLLYGLQCTEIAMNINILGVQISKGSK